MLIEINEWPMGLCRDLALLLEEDVDSLNLKFQRDQDDLDSFSYSIIQTKFGTFALRLNDNQPASGYKLIGMEGLQNSRDQIANFLQASGITSEAILWQTPVNLSN